MKNFENVLESDPLKLKKYDTPNYKRIYSVCVFIPVLLAFAIVFFLIFFMSPSSRHMRQYQSGIYDWNKSNTSFLMDQLQFAFKIVPYEDSYWSTLSMVTMERHTMPDKTEEE